MKFGSAAGALAVLLSCAAALVAGVIEVFLVPLRFGTAFVPIGVLVAAVGNVILPLTARRAVDTGAAATATVACWFVAVVGLGMFTRPEGDVVIPGGGGEQWIYLATVLVGLAAGALTAFGGLPGIGKKSSPTSSVSP